MEFVAGAVMMGAVAASMLFLKAHRRTLDPLFGHFSLAFLLLAADRVALVLVSRENEHGYAVYLLRLLAFATIIVGVLRKNVRRKGRSRRNGSPAPGARA